MCQLSQNSGNLKLVEPSGPIQACTGLAVFLPIVKFHLTLLLSKTGISCPIPHAHPYPLLSVFPWVPVPCSSSVLFVFLGSLLRSPFLSFSITRFSAPVCLLLWTFCQTGTFVNEHIICFPLSPDVIPALTILLSNFCCCCCPWCRVHFPSAICPLRHWPSSSPL